MPIDRKYAQFAGSRVRFQRLRDAALFNGWVESFDGKHLSVTAATDRAVLAGDIAQFEIAGFSARSIFRAHLWDVAIASVNADCDVQTLAGMSLLHVKSVTMYFEVVGDVRLVPSVEKGRLKSSSVGMNLLLPNGGTSQARIVDVSVEGVGILSEVSLAQNQEIPFVIESHLGPVQGVGQVRYCRRDSNSEGHFRIGIRLASLGRIDVHRWHRVIAEAA